MANNNYDPNARFDQGPASAGADRMSTQVILQSGTNTGLAFDSCMTRAHSRDGFNAAGVSRNNGGPNVAGAQKSINKR